MKRHLTVAVFFSGMTTLAAEMSASRLIGNYFGTSNLVWASIIGLILIYLTAGYFLGGALADRSPHYRTFYRILCWGAFTIGLIPVISRPVLRVSAAAFDTLQLGTMFGSLAAVLVLFIIPITLLGTASPFAIRLAIQDTRQAGHLSGRISAISTLGSFIGTFLPALVLIPTIGTYRTFLVFSGLLLIIALWGLWFTSGWKAALPYFWMPVVILFLGFYGTPGSDKNSTGQIFETESAYNYIQVLKKGDFRFLRLNDGQGVHSIYNPVQLNYGGPWEQVLVAPFFNPPEVDLRTVDSLAIVGLAAGTTARQATSVFGEIPIDGFEIDPKIVEIGYQYFGMNQPNLNVIIQDGRVGLARSNRLYRIISVDAYRPPYIPWHLTTREFFQIVHNHLTPDGVMVINVGRGPADRRLINTLGSTIASVFHDVHVMDIPGTFNSILFASVQPTSAANLEANFQALAQKSDTPPLLLDTMRITLGNLKPAFPRTAIFTDDLAPIEWITNDMVIKFLLTGDMETLQ